MQKPKKKILFIITGIFVLIAIIGTSYAFFVSNIAGLESASSVALKATYLELTFEDQNDVISGEDIIPGWSASKTFTVTNTGDGLAYYAIRVKDIVNEFTVPNSISISIASNDGGRNVYKRVLPTSEQDITTGIEIDVGVTHTYTVTAYYNNLPNADQFPDLGKSFSFAITIGEAAKAEPKGWSNAASGTLLAGIKANQSEPNTSCTKAGQVTATTNEGLCKTEDDYGISYYYRGAVENNYVVFAGMCWRIVRVDGLGNTKLTLYNYNPSGVANPCTQTNNTNAFARVNNAYQTMFNSNYSKNTYVGYMYSNNPNSTDFDTAHANDNDSTILTFLKTWYDEKLRSYNDLLADVIWCNDKSIITDITYNPINYSNLSGTGLGKDKTYYGAAKRLYPTSEAGPSLMCPSAGKIGTLSKFTASDKVNGNGALTFDGKEYKIGLLTADEIAFAGATTDTRNSSYYLYGNTSGDYYWSLSPDVMGDDFALVLAVRSDGFLSSPGVFEKSVRPAVSLKADTTITTKSDDNKGSANNPFIVQ